MRKLLDALSYPRGYVVSVALGLWTLVMSVVVLAAAFLTGSQPFLDILINTGWSRPVLWFSGVTVERRGLDRVSRQGQGFLILFNHSSFMDIPVLFAHFPRLFRFGAKIELFRVPFFGAAMRACGVLPIDRSNRGKVMKIYEQAIARVNRGECFALAPEGTRQNEPRIGTFKRGPFEFAVNAQMDLVPVVLAGAYDVLPRKSVWLNQGRWRRKIIMEILPPVSTRGLTSDDLESLQARVRVQMEETFKRLTQDLALSPTPIS